MSKRNLVAWAMEQGYDPFVDYTAGHRHGNLPDSVTAIRAKPEYAEEMAQTREQRQPYPWAKELLMGDPPIRIPNGTPLLDNKGREFSVTGQCGDRVWYERDGHTHNIFIGHCHPVHPGPGDVGKPVRVVSTAASEKVVGCVDSARRVGYTGTIREWYEGGAMVDTEAWFHPDDLMLLADAPAPPDSRTEDPLAAFVAQLRSSYSVKAMRRAADAIDAMLAARCDERDNQAHIVYDKNEYNAGFDAGHDAHAAAVRDAAIRAIRGDTCNT